MFLTDKQAIGVTCIPDTIVCVRKRSTTGPPSIFDDEVLRDIFSPTPPVTPERMPRLLICVDAGTAYTKCVYRVFGPDEDSAPRMCEEQIMAAFDTIRWIDNEHHVPTQLAYTESGDRLWGIQVTDALHHGTIRSEDVVGNLKLLLFNDVQVSQGQQDERQRLRTRMINLRSQGYLPQLPAVITEIDDAAVHEFLGLYSEFLRLAYDYVLDKIRLAHPTLVLEDTVIEVAIPLPVRTDPREAQLVLAAVKAADIPNPFVVGEPAAAMAYHYQHTFEKYKRLPHVDCTLICDVGGGSADLEGWVNVGTSPFRVQERCPGDTQWCGGALVNNRCVDMIMCDIDHLGHVLTQMNCHGLAMDEQGLRQALESQFEKEKKRFRGTESVTLIIPGLPSIEQYRMRGGNRVVLTANEMRQIYEPSLASLRGMINTALCEIKRRSAAETSQVELLLVGGGSSSPYLIDQLKNSCMEVGKELFGYPVVLRSPNDNSMQASTTVANGSLLLLMDKAFITKRITTRGYCIAWDKPLGRISGKVDSIQPIEKSPFNDFDEALQVSQFFIRPGDCLSLQYESCHQGWRGLSLDEAGPHGWEFLEYLYWTDSICEDDIWVERPGIDMHRMPHPLKFSIPYEWSKDWTPQWSQNPKSSPWFHIEYKVRLRLDGMKMTFELVVPKTGNFTVEQKKGRSKKRRADRFSRNRRSRTKQVVVRQDQERDGDGEERDKDCKVQRGQFDVNGCFKLLDLVS